VLPDRIELSASPLPRGCSTTELRQHLGALSKKWSPLPVDSATVYFAAEPCPARRGLLCHRPNLDARPKSAYQPGEGEHDSRAGPENLAATMSKSEQAALREQRLAAKLRENLKRRKGQAKARADSERQAPDPQPGPETDTVNKP
jgi:hypothetical protein